MDDVKTARKEIVDLFKHFLSNDVDKTIHQKAIDLERRFASLATLNDYSKKRIVPNDLVEAISSLPKIYQFGEGIFDDRKSVEEIKMLLKKLRFRQASRPT